MKTITQIGRDHYVSPGIVSRIMEQMNYPKPASLPRTIAIDEFRGNVGEKFQCLLMDPQHHTVLDVLPTRNSKDLHAYFNQYLMKERKKVRYIVMDLSLLIGVSNGFIEGCNNRTKVLKRISYGFRNFKRFRNRLFGIANNTEI